MTGRESSFWTGLSGILGAIGTLVAAAAGVIALFISTGGKHLPASSVGAAATVTARATPTQTAARPTQSASAPAQSVVPPAQNVSSPATSPPGHPRRPKPPKSPGPPAISGVAFTGDTTAPTVIVTGSGFGAGPPAGQANNSTNCGSYSNNGDDYGPSGLSFEDTGNFAAGTGTPPNGSCVGIIVLTWSDNQVVYEFGNAYNSFDHWYISAGDQYTVSVDGASYSGTVSFSS